MNYKCTHVSKSRLKSLALRFIEQFGAKGLVLVFSSYDAHYAYLEFKKMKSKRAS